MKLTTYDYEKNERTIETPEESIYNYFEKQIRDKDFYSATAYDYFGTTCTFRQFLNDIDKEMKKRDTYQGKKLEKN